MSFKSVTIKASPWKVGTLVQLKREGKLMLPDLQRGFVGDPGPARFRRFRGARGRSRVGPP